MKKIIIILTMFLVGCFPIKKEKQNQCSAIFQVCHDHSKGVSCGSAFLVKYRNKMFVLTAAHVVYDGNMIWLLKYNNEVSPIKIISVINPNFEDIAILLVDGIPKNHPYFELASAKGLSIEKVESYGYNKYLFKSKGNLLDMQFATSAKGQAKTYLLSDCQMIGGMSGGPLLYEGKVIGVNIAKMVDIEGLRGVHVDVDNFIDELDAMIDQF